MSCPIKIPYHVKKDSRDIFLDTSIIFFPTAVLSPFHLPNNHTHYRIRHHNLHHQIHLPTHLQNHLDYHNHLHRIDLTNNKNDKMNFLH